MAKNETNFERNFFVRLGVLTGFIMEFLSTILNDSQIDYWIGHKSELKKNILKIFSIVDENSLIREEWQNFYKINFNWDVDFSQVIIPPMPIDGYRWLLRFIPKGMTLNFAFKVCEKLFASWKYYDDLDKAISKNIRNTDSHYAIWVRDEVEPDQEFFNKSTTEADPEMKIGITLLERIIFEIKYFLETGKHLDIKGVTFCSGSRYSDGYVPGAGWYYDGGFEVSWYDLGRSDSDYGVRSAV